MLLAAAAVVLLQLAVRAWLVSGRDLYADDLLYEGRAATTPLLSVDGLAPGYDGQLMPLAFLLAGVVTRIAPLEWWAPALLILLMQLGASVAVLRLLRTLLGDRLRLLAPFTLFAVSTLSLGPLTWWASAINSLPLQIAIAWYVTEAVLLVRTGRRRHAVVGTVVLVVGLGFYVKAVLVAPVALAAVAVLLAAEGGRRPLVQAWQRGSRLWVPALLVTAGWTLAYVATVPSGGRPAVVGELAEVTATGIGEVLVPSLLGGPWVWLSATGAVPLAVPPAALVAVAGLLVGLAIAATCALLRGAAGVWALVVGHALAALLLVGLGRSGTSAGDAVVLAHRHFAGDAVVIALGLALLLLLPARHPQATRPAPGRLLRAAPALAVAAVVVSSLVSTVTYAQAWSVDRTGSWLAAARASLAAAGPSPLLDQTVPEDIVWSLSAPDNVASVVLAPLTDRPRFADATDRLQLLDDSGTLRPARVDAGLTVTAVGCVPTVDAAAPTPVLLSGDAFAWTWTVRLAYRAEQDGEVTVGLTEGDTVRVPLQRGAHEVFVRLTGSGDRVVLDDASTPVCVTAGELGNIALA